jgi:hypothetical protein
MHHTRTHKPQGGTMLHSKPSAPPVQRGTLDPTVDPFQVYPEVCMCSVQCTGACVVYGAILLTHIHLSLCSGGGRMTFISPRPPAHSSSSSSSKKRYLQCGCMCVCVNTYVGMSHVNSYTMHYTTQHCTTQRTAAAAAAGG